MYFPVCVSNKKRSEDETEEGLGSLPRNISSVSSLLLFNTTENLSAHTQILTLNTDSVFLLLMWLDFCVLEDIRSTCSWILWREP